MDNAFQIDFKKIEEALDKRFQHGDDSILAKNPDAKLDDIHKIANISKAVCLAALQEYHLALTQVLAEQPQPMPQGSHPGSKDEH